MIGHVIASSLPPSQPPTAMGKRKNKLDTLTKIDPSVLRPSPFSAVSQHATGFRTRVSTPICPVLPRPTQTLCEPPIFGADPSNFAEGCQSDDEDDEDISKSYFSVKVWSPRVP